MPDWWPAGPPPEHRAVWDAERQLFWGAFYTRDATVHWLYEGLDKVVTFHGNDWSSRSLTEAERLANPGCDYLEVWSITEDTGAGLYADKRRRRALIVDFLHWRSAMGAERRKDAPLAQRPLPWVEVRFDVPFEGR